MEYSKVDSLIAIDNSSIKRSIYNSLHSVGLTKIIDSINHNEIDSKLKKSSLDLIIATSEINNFFIGNLVSSIRNGIYEYNLFPIIIILSNIADRDYVKKLVNSGPDDILLLPISTEQLLYRLDTLAHRRRPFVVTHDYSGPDRRRKPRSGEEKIPLIEVPNPLLTKSTGQNIELMHRRSIATARQLNLLKVNRYAVQINWLETALRQAHTDNPANIAIFHSYFIRLKALCNDIRQRVHVYPQSGITISIDGLENTIVRLNGKRTPLEPQELNELEDVSNRLVQSIFRLSSQEKIPVTSQAVKAPRQDASAFATAPRMGL